VVAEVQLAAFAHELKLFESEAAYDADGAADQPKFAVESFIPSTLRRCLDENQFAHRWKLVERLLPMVVLVRVEHKRDFPLIWAIFDLLMFGLPRRTDPTCARAYANSLAEHDAKKVKLCPQCQP